MHSATAPITMQRWLRSARRVRAAGIAVARWHNPQTPLWLCLTAIAAFYVYRDATRAARGSFMETITISHQTLFLATTIKADNVATLNSGALATRQLYPDR